MLAYAARIKDHFLFEAELEQSLPQVFLLCRSNDSLEAASYEPNLFPDLYQT